MIIYIISSIEHNNDNMYKIGYSYKSPSILLEYYNEIIPNPYYLLQYYIKDEHVNDTINIMENIFDELYRHYVYKNSNSRWAKMELADLITRLNNKYVPIYY